jgi:hypothetical protein
MMERMDPMQQLLAIVKTGEFEDCGRMRVVSAHWSADRLSVRLQVDHGTDESSAWQLRFTRVLEHLFADVYNCGLNIWRREHPAIDQYLQPRAFLHFAAAPIDPHRVAGRLWADHVQVVDDWIPFERYINRELPLPTLLASGSGLVATGPMFIIKAYEAILESENCKPTMKELPRARAIKSATLTQFGESYVIAEDVVARRLAAA